MSVPAAYIGVIIIWSTTPLAIKWSAQGAGFLFGVTARMAIGAALCLLLAQLLRVRLPWHRTALRGYAAAGIGVYGAMMCVYWSSQFVPSGLISVLFGLSPIITGILAAIWLDERSLTVPRIAGSMVGLGGLGLIFGSQGELGPHAGVGLAGVLLSVLLHCLSTVWVKRIGAELPALAMTTGALLFALPCYLLTWAVLDGQPPPEAMAPRALWSIVYLGVFGSGLGFILFYYALRRVEAARLALIPLTTPVIALLLGHAFDGEALGGREIAGAGLILSGLFFYEWGERVMELLRRRAARAAED